MEQIINKASKLAFFYSSKRIKWIDIAKFFGFILMVVGHVIDNYDIARGFIYSFHMPLFFILSFVTLSLSSDWKSYKNNLKKRTLRILIPYYASVLLMIIIDIILKPSRFLNGTFWYNQIDRIFCYVGMDQKSAVGPLWFIFCLYFLENIFDFLHLFLKDDRYLFVACLFLTIIGVILGNKNLHLYLVFDLVLASFIFCYVGYLLRKGFLIKNPWIGLVISLAVWLTILLCVTWNNIHWITYFEMWPRRWLHWIFDFSCAIAGSMALIYLSILISKIKYVSHFTAYLGSHNIFFLVIYTFSSMYISKKWRIITTKIPYLNRFVVELVLFLIEIIIITGYVYLKKLIANKKTPITK